MRIEKITSKDLRKIIKEATNPIHKQIKDCLSDYEYGEDLSIAYYTEGYQGKNLGVGDIVIINGNAEVDHILGDCLEKNAFGERASLESGSILIVLGNVKTKYLFSSGAIFITGNVIVEHILVHSWNDEALVIGGNLQTDVIVEDGHHCMVVGDVNAKSIVSLHNPIESKGNINATFIYDEDTSLEDVFIDEVLDEEGDLDHLQYEKLLKKGKQVLISQLTPEQRKQQKSAKLKLVTKRTGSKIPARPKGVPDEANWNSDNKEWELGDHDEKEKEVGYWRWWRPEGQLLAECIYNKTGKLHGMLRRYHPDGTISMEGTYKNGKEEGDITYYRSEHPTEEHFPDEGAPKKVGKVIMKYEKGEFMEWVYFLKDGTKCNYQGRPLKK